MKKNYTSIFSVNDRIGRLQFIVSYLLFFALTIGVAFLFEESCSPFFITFYIMTCWPCFCIFAKRGHDANIGAIFSIIIVIVSSILQGLYAFSKNGILYVSLIYIVVLGLFLLLPKVDKNNRFGDSRFRLSLRSNKGYRAFIIWLSIFIIVLIPVYFLYKIPELPISNDKLSLKNLALTAPTVVGEWVEKDVLEDDIGAWTGSCFAIKSDDKFVYFVTNNHVLALKELSKSDPDRSIEVYKYSLKLKMPSGKIVPIAKFRHRNDDLDIAMLLVENDKIKKGVDYIIVPFNPAVKPKVGDETVAVGSPRGLAGTHTFGKISALRENDAYIQIETPINPGNSGGPLFIKRGDRFSLIGINTFKIRNSENLNFAVNANLINVGEYKEYSADKYGAAKCLTDKYNVVGKVR